MARAKKSTQPAPNLTEQEQAKAHYTQEVIEEQCQIRMPGKWLESKLTDAEVADIVKLQETIEKYKDNTSDEKKLDLIAPYLNSLMHLMYLMIKDKYGLTTTEEGVTWKENNPEGKFFNIIRYTADFISDDFKIGSFLTEAVTEMIEQGKEQKPKKKIQAILQEEPSISKRIALVDFTMEMLKDPLEALAYYGKGYQVTQYSQQHFEQLIQTVAKQTGADPEQVRNPETRTEEQEKALTLEAGKETVARFEAYRQSNFFFSLELLMKEESQYPDNPEAVEGGYYDNKKATALYFFALHPEINPQAKASLTAEQIEELKAIYHRLDAFYMEKTGGQKLPPEEGDPLFFEFIEAENPNNTTLPVIITKKIQEIAYPLDKVNSSFWGLIPGEQATLKAESDRDSRKGKEANIYVLLDFDEMKGTGVTISRPLTSYDKRVFIAAANLKEQGHDTVTTTQIYEAMGNRSRPNAQQRQKILRSIETMSLCRVTLDNSEEAAMYTSYDKVKRTFYLLPTTIDKGYVNGLIVDDAITIIELPRLFIFAKKRGQFASTSVALLESPISKTEANLQLEDYLLTRISRMKNAKKRKKPYSPVILLDTLYKNCDINDKHKRSRATEKIDRLLQHYKKQEFINGYKLTAKSIDIDL